MPRSVLALRFGARWVELVLFFEGVKRVDPTPGALAGCLLFFRAGATRNGSPPGLSRGGPARFPGAGADQGSSGRIKVFLMQPSRVFLMQQ